VNLKAIRENVRLTTLIEALEVTNAEIGTLVNQGLYEVSAIHPWPWLETSVNLSLTDSQRVVDLPGNFDTGIALVDDDVDRNIPYVSSKLFFELVGNDTGNESADPRYFTIYEEGIYLHPIPSTTDSDRMTLYYTTTVSELSTDTDEPLFHRAFHWMLVEYVAWKLYNREEYYDQSERAFITYSRYLNEMLSFYGRPFKAAPFRWGDGRTPGVRVQNIPLLDDF